MMDDHASEIEDLQHLMNGLLSTLSHDLRTPLSAITGWLYLLESEKLDAAAKKRALEKIRANVDEQVRLIDDILLLSRSKTGHLTLDPAVILPDAPLFAALEKVRPAAIAAKVKLNATKVEQIGKVIADSEHLGRVFEILLSHAVKSTPPGGAVETAIRVQDSHIVITIADNGKGVIPAELPFVFDPFTKKNGGSGDAYAGAGRSLMLAKTLVEIQNGQLLAASPGPGLGATFTVLLSGIAADRATNQPVAEKN